MAPQTFPILGSGRWIWWLLWSRYISIIWSLRSHSCDKRPHLIHWFIILSYFTLSYAELTFYNLNQRAFSEIQTLFKDFDTDKDGYITPVELDRALKRLGITPSQLELNAMFKAADKDKDGRINLGGTVKKTVKKWRHSQLISPRFSEFKDLVRNCPALQSLQQAFRQFDLDGDGHITKDELRKVIIELGQRASEVEIEAMFQAADVNKDSKITFEGKLTA